MKEGEMNKRDGTESSGEMYVLWGREVGGEW